MSAPRTPEKKRPADSGEGPTSKSPKKALGQSSIHSPSKDLAGLTLAKGPAGPKTRDARLRKKKTAENSSQVQVEEAEDEVSATLERARNEFEGPYAQAYLQSLSMFSKQVGGNKSTPGLFSNLVIDAADPRYPSPEVQHWMTPINLFISTLLQQPEILVAIKTIHQEKNQVFNQSDTLAQKLTLINTIMQHVKAKQPFAHLLPTCDALLDEAQARQIREINEDLEQKIGGDFIKLLERQCQQLEKQSKKRIPPLCISFMAITMNDQSNKIIINISSPSKNTNLLERIHHFIRSQPQFQDFVIGETASPNLHKLLDYTNQLTGIIAPKNPDRECAEKSALATLLKLKSKVNFTPKFIFNFALEPGAVKLIPCCEDCKKNMPGANALLNINPVLISPTKVLDLSVKAPRIPSFARSDLFTVHGEQRVEGAIAPDTTTACGFPPK